MEIKLREKPISKGTRKSLFLQISGDGKIVKEYLHLYLYTKPVDAREKNHNAETLTLAETIKAKRLLQMQARHYGVPSKQLLALDFIDYFEKWAENYGENHADTRKVYSCIAKLRDFTAKKRITRLNGHNLTKLFAEDFAYYLVSVVKPASARSYFSKFVTVLKRAYSEGMLSFHPGDIEVRFRIDTNAITKPMLTEAEVAKMAKTECPNPEVKRAYLFCYNTGFDYATISKHLTWGCIDGRWIIIERSKTERTKRYYINDNALALLPPKPGKPKELIFNLPTWEGCVKIIRAWAAAAGIHKKLTWHSIRHSLGANMVNEHGVDIRVVKELLGHDDIKSTMRYTRVNEKTKADAVDKIKKMDLG